MHHQTASLPLIYACAGGSDAAQLANALALRMDRAGVAQMGCSAGLGAGLPAMLEQARSGRRLIALDGCEMRCAVACLAAAGLQPDLALMLGDEGIHRHPGRDFSAADLARLEPRVRRAIELLAPKAEPEAVPVSTMRISG